VWNPFDFSGKKIVVVGATSGMGKATAIRLSQQGAQVQLIGRSQEKLDEVIQLLSGNGHRSFAKDLGQTDGYKDVLDDIVSDGKKIDGLVYCAGIAKILPVSMLSKKTMDESMTVNLYSFVELVGLLSKKKYHADRASIVGVSSISTQYPQKCQGIYVATKAAMNGMVTAMAMELAEKGIRINTVLPSLTKTKMYDEAIEGKSEEEIQQIMRKQVLGLLNPEDVADVIMFLLSDASKMITGRSIYADAGFINF
jgi:NAD(P)-dependent dehydrogenase (short-subunit alcohol dehydrogenase family)